MSKIDDTTLSKMFPEMFVLSDKISVRYNLFGSGLPTRLRTTVLPWHNPEPVHSVYGSPGSRAKQNSVSYSHFFKFCSVLFTSAAFSRAGARLLNNRNLRHSYCSRGERSQAPALLNRPLVFTWRSNMAATSRRA